MADFTPDQEKEFEFRLRYEQEQAPKAAAPDQVNPLYGATAGFIGGELGGPMINAGAKEFERAKVATQMGVRPSDLVLEQGLNGTDRWVLSSGKGLGESPDILGRVQEYNDRQAELNALKSKQAAPVGGVAKHGTRGATLSAQELARLDELEHMLGAGRAASMESLAAKQAAAAKAAMPAGEKLAEALGIPRMGQTAARALGAGVSRGVPAVIGRGIAGAGAGFQGVDAYNRFQRGDIGGGVISGLGALGSAASLIPHPLTRGVGTVVGVGAEALNAYLDSLKKKPAMAKGGHVTVDKKDGLSKAEKAALLIMNNKKKVKHLADGGTVQAFGGAYPGALTMGGSVTPIDPVAAPVTTATGDSTFSNTNLGGLSGLLAGNTPAAPTAVPAYTPMPATLDEWQAQQQKQNGNLMTTAVNPWAGTNDANGTWIRNPDQNAAYAAYAAQQNAANAPQPVGIVSPAMGQQSDGSWDYGTATPIKNSAPAPAPAPAAPVGGLPNTKPATVSPVMQAGSNVPMALNSPVAAATPKTNPVSAAPAKPIFNKFGTPMNQVRQAGVATPQASTRSRGFAMSPLASLRHR